MKQPSEEALISTLKLDLDNGEAEAIALAVELQADLLLIDELKGRKIARRLNCNPVGILGVLVEAKHRNLITNVKPIVNDLRQKAGFYISQAVYKQVMSIVGE